MHNAVMALPADVKKKVVAGVLFGDTRYKADGGQIKNYPKSQVIIFCAKENNPPDATCDGKPPNKGHFVYTGLAFFRQLPAGVPGAYRLFANLISLGK